MISYVRWSARTFDGFCIKHCESAPLKIGVRKLNEARRENLELYVCAELFIDSEEIQLRFL